MTGNPTTGNRFAVRPLTIQKLLHYSTRHAIARQFRLQFRRPVRDVGDGGDGCPGALPLANFRCPGGTFGAWLDNAVEQQGVIKFLTVRDLVFRSFGGNEGLN